MTSALEQACADMNTRMAEIQRRQRDVMRARRLVYLESLRALGSIRRLYARWTLLPEWGRPLSLGALQQEFRHAYRCARNSREQARRLP